MGDYFDKDEIENDKKQKKDDDDDQIEQDLLGIEKIIPLRNSLVMEYKLKVPDYEERIGRFNLLMFGDPNNPDWESRLDKFDEELEHPLTRTHPIAKKGKEFVQGVRELQAEYHKLHKYLKLQMKRTGELWDNTIKLCLQLKDENKRMREEYKQEVQKILDAVGGSSKDKYLVPPNKVKEFLNLKGKLYLTQAMINKKQGNQDVHDGMKAAFIAAANDFFKDQVENTATYSEYLFITQMSKLEKEYVEDTPKLALKPLPQHEQVQAPAVPLTNSRTDIELEGLDDTDKRIIQMMKENPEISQNALAKEIGISQPSIYARIKKLKEKGLLKIIML